MKLTVLGCGDAFGSGGRYNTSFLLSEGKVNVLVDCGASTLIRLKELDISLTDIDTIIITHFHGDHYGGLPFLMLSYFYELQSEQEITIIGPEGIREQVYKLQEAMYPDTSKVLDSLNLNFREYKLGELLSHHDFSVLARAVAHSPASRPHGIKLIWNEKSFGFSGDTEWIDSLIELAADTDLFILECNNLNFETPGHLSYDTILTKRHLLNTQNLYLTHMGIDIIRKSDTEILKLYDGLVINF